MKDISFIRFFWKGISINPPFQTYIIFTPHAWLCITTKNFFSTVAAYHFNFQTAILEYYHLVYVYICSFRVLNIIILSFFWIQFTTVTAKLFNYVSLDTILYNGIQE